MARGCEASDDDGTLLGVASSDDGSGSGGARLFPGAQGMSRIWGDDGRSTDGRTVSASSSSSSSSSGSDSSMP